MRFVVEGTRGAGTDGRLESVRSAARGFSLVELVVTVVLAGIIFLAMVPLFVSGLKTTSTNTRRVVATNIAQAQLDKVRVLGATPSSYANITNANLNSSTWNPNLISTTYTPPAGGQPYNISTSVSPDASTAPYKTVTVTVSRPNDSFQTKVSTVVQNPIPVSTSSTSGPSAGNGPFPITAAFKNSAEVSSKGVYVVQIAYTSATPTPMPTATVTISPTLHPAASPTNSTVTWPSLPGGMSYMYIVYCYSNDWNSGNTALYTPTTHLLGNDWVKFDTNPGGS